MRIAFLYLIAALGITSCDNSIDSNNSEKTTPQDSLSITSTDEIQTSIDTIIERNNPNSLDLEKHQIFIDTTRKSEYYEKIKSWEASTSLMETIEQYKSDITDSLEYFQSHLKNFPLEWIVLKKFRNEFLIHCPCNGIGGRYVFSNNSVDFFSLEPDTDLINSVEKDSKDHLILNLKVHKEKSETQTAILSMRKTEWEHIFLLKIVYDHVITYRLVTPSESVHEFDLLIENCQDLVSSQIDFDKIEYEGIENEL